MVPSSRQRFNIAIPGDGVQKNAWEVAFGYVAVAPFSTLSTANFLNSGEWTLQWSTRQIGIAPLPLSMFPTEQRTSNRLRCGVEPRGLAEFTRSQIHMQHDYSLTENAARNARWHFSPVQVSFVNLTNKDEAFTQWLLDQDNPLIQARFNNHLNLGSALGWETDWSVGAWQGRVDMKASWAGGLTQRMAQAWASPESFDESTGAWLVTSDVPLIQYQRMLLKDFWFAGIAQPTKVGHSRQRAVWVGQRRQKPLLHCRLSKPFSVEAPMAFAGGVCAPLGQATPV